MKRTNRNPWDILNIPKNSPIEKVKEAFKREALRTHPDRGGNMEEFRLVNEAFNKIKAGKIVPIVSGPKTKLVNLPLSVQQQIQGVDDYIELGNGDIVHAKIPAGSLVDEKFKVFGETRNYILNIKEGKDKVFTRSGFSLIIVLHLELESAMIGCKKIIEGPTGEDIEIDIPSGTQNGDTITLENHGLYNRKKKFRGSLNIVFKVDIPKLDTSNEIEEFIKRLKNVRN